MLMVSLYCRATYHLFSWMESPFCPVDGASSPPCRTSFELPRLQPPWPASPRQPSATPSSRILSPSRLWRPSARWSAPSWAVCAGISQSGVGTVLRTSRELSHGSACFQSQGWTLGRLVEGWISLGGRTARKEGKNRKYCEKETTSTIYIHYMESLCVMFAQGRLWLPWQPVAALPTPSAWPDSDSLHLTA